MNALLISLVVLVILYLVAMTLGTIMWWAWGWLFDRPEDHDQVQLSDDEGWMGR